MDRSADANRLPHRLNRLEEYVAMVQQKNNHYWKINEFKFSDPPTVVPMYGKKYARIIKVDQLNGSRSVHSFVNMVNGDILKGSWNAPVKNGVRGNIWADDLGASVVNEHGPHYLKSGRRKK